MSSVDSTQFTPDICRPIQIAEEDREVGPRIGGKPPFGVKPEVIREDETEYLLTLPWLHGNELSLFLWLSAVESGDNSLWKNCRKVHTSSNPCVQMVVHAKAARSSDKLLASSLPSRSLKIASPMIDVSPDDPEVPWGNHKLGGKPFFEDAGSHAYELASNVIYGGHVHVLQLTFPTQPDAVINANWPFGEMIFHLFASIEREVIDFKYMWA